jgi:hypothetical protein
MDNFLGLRSTVFTEKYLGSIWLCCSESCSGLYPVYTFTIFAETCCVFDLIPVPRNSHSFFQLQLCFHVLSTSFFFRCRPACMCNYFAAFIHRPYLLNLKRLRFGSWCYFHLQVTAVFSGTSGPFLWPEFHFCGISLLKERRKWNYEAIIRWISIVWTTGI